MLEINVKEARGNLSAIKENHYLPIQTKHFSTAMNWTAKFNTLHGTLDALHLAIAVQNKAPLLTADIKFAESAQKLGISVTLLKASSNRAINSNVRSRPR